MHAFRSRLFRLAPVAALLAAVALAGCSRYYKVTDNARGDVYYTDDFPVRSYQEVGRASFVDARTGAVVTLTDVDVERVGRKRAIIAAHASVGEGE